MAVDVGIARGERDARHVGHRRAEAVPVRRASGREQTVHRPATVERRPAERERRDLALQHTGHERTVTGHHDVEWDRIGSSLHRDPLADRGGRLGHSLEQEAARIGGVGLLEEEVLDVGVRDREGPGDVGVVADADARQAGDRKPHGLVPAAVEPDLVPDGGVADREVRVALEERLPRRRARAGERDAVGAQPGGGIAEDRVERLETRKHRGRPERAGDRAPRAVLDARGRPRIGVGEELGHGGRAGARGHVRARQLGLIVRRQVVRLELQDDERVRRSPRLGLVAKEHELDRERVAPLLEELVHPLRVRAERDAGLV